MPPGLERLQDPPACQGPLAFVRPPAFPIPAGACDTHAHVIGTPPGYPLVANRSYTAPEATLASYLAMLDAQGMERGVLVQVSIHGTDNRLLLEALAAAPKKLRGVAVVGPDVRDDELDQLHAAGIRGIRLNVLFGGGVSIDHMEHLARRIARLGWHIQLLIDARILPEIGNRMLGLPVDVVIDHMGHMPVSQMRNHPGFGWLLKLLGARKAWVKLSGAYRVSEQGAPFEDAIEPVRRLANAAPDRCLWGSDWPHVAVTGPMFNTGDLLDHFGAAIPEADDRRRILVDNPKRLYGFELT